MSRLDQHPDIIQMASELGLDTESNAVEQITAYCRRRIEGWLREENVVPDTMPQIEGIVRKRLRLVFEEVWSDDDLQRIVNKYISLKEFVFATLTSDLDENTFATLMERRHVTATSEDRYVAVIDCRGDKEARRFFTKWHEIAHLLTLIRQLELPFHRSTADKSPTERLMDAIAGEVGFYDPILRPVLAAEMRAAGKLTFEGVQRIRDSVFPEASFRATLNACAARAAVPIVLVEAGMGLKKQERKAVESKQMTLIPLPPPEPQLRALVSIGNDAARRKGLLPSSTVTALGTTGSTIIFRVNLADAHQLRDSLPAGVGADELSGLREFQAIARIGAHVARIQTPRFRAPTAGHVRDLIISESHRRYYRRADELSQP